jgi:VanZ family protein
LTHKVLRPELRHWRLWLGLGIVMLVGIAIVCLIPQQSLPSVGLSDKTEHFATFGLLTFWFGTIVVRRDLPWVALGVLLFGGLIEIAQSAMGLGRSGDWMDLLADGIGVVLGSALALSPLYSWMRAFAVRRGWTSP